MAGKKSLLKKLLFFSEPNKHEKFVLQESKDESQGTIYSLNNDDAEEAADGQDGSDATTSGEAAPKSNKKRVKNEHILLNKNACAGKEKDKEGEEQKEDGEEKTKQGDTGEAKKKQDGAGEAKKKQDDGAEDDKGTAISCDIEESLQYIKNIYSVPSNSDIIIREFHITVKDKVIDAFTVYFDGMVDRKVINDNILQPLMLLSNLELKDRVSEVGEYVKTNLIPSNHLIVVKSYEKMVKEINFGSCAIFIDGLGYGFASDVKSWEHRTVERPNTELVIRGPQEGFTEVLRINTALIRKILKDEDLINEGITVGKRSKTPCSILYIKDITNDNLVKEVRRRMKSIKVDYVLDSGELEQFLEDNTYIPAPQIIATERPDRVASLLVEGKVAIIMNGSPFALVVPATLPGLVKTPEDQYIRFPYATFLRVIRMVGIFMSFLLPGLYVAITNYHQEMIPTDLLLAIASSREKVPFPAVVEILIMEFSFELIREAGVRIPGPIGPTLGIIGALILGQAAVAANIVSPILIIIVAVTGIGSFSVPNFSFGIALRIIRFIYIFLGALIGFLGITTGLFIHGILLVSAKSFGVPLMVPFAPKTAGGTSNEITLMPIWKKEKRPDYLNTKDDKKQPKISRQWTTSSSEGDDGDEK